MQNIGRIVTEVTKVSNLAQSFLSTCRIILEGVPVTNGPNVRWLPRVFTNNPSYLAYDTKGNLVTLSLRFGSRNSPIRLPM